MLDQPIRLGSPIISLGQKHVGSFRFAQYYSLRIFARYAGRYVTKGIESSND